MMRSDLNVPTPAIPMPDLAVPYAAPMPIPFLALLYLPGIQLFEDVHPKIICTGGRQYNAS